MWASWNVVVDYIDTALGFLSKITLLSLHLSVLTIAIPFDFFPTSEQRHAH
jgi:hypothetical protein